jgi:hypothetical protein
VVKNITAHKTGVSSRASLREIIIRKKEKSGIKKVFNPKTLILKISLRIPHNKLIKRADSMSK